MDEDLHEIGYWAYSAVDALNKERLAMRKAESDIHRGPKIIDDCTFHIIIENVRQSHSPEQGPKFSHH